MIMISGTATPGQAKNEFAPVKKTKKHPSWFDFLLQPPVGVPLDQVVSRCRNVSID